MWKRSNTEKSNPWFEASYFLSRRRFWEIRQMIKFKVYQSKISSKLSRVVYPISSETITKFLGIAVKNIRQWTQVWSSDFD
jgi:hypothetical protein